MSQTPWSHVKCNWHDGTSCVKLQRMGLPPCQGSTMEWHLWYAPRWKKVEVRLWRCTASSIKKPSVPRQSRHGDVMNTVVKTVNIIWARGLYHRRFQAFLSDVDDEYGDILYHSDVHWLSHGSVLQRFYSLWSEIGQFFKEKDRPLHELSDPLFGRPGFLSWS